MAKYPTIKEILALNPHIDENELEKAREILRKLRNQGTRKAGYALALPFRHRRIVTGESDSVDPRTILLRHSRR